MGKKPGVLLPIVKFWLKYCSNLIHIEVTVFEKTAEAMQECKQIIAEGKQNMYSNELELDNMEKEYSNTITQEVQ